MALTKRNLVISTVEPMAFEKQFSSAINVALDQIALSLRGEAKDIISGHSHSHGKGHIYTGTLFDDAEAEAFQDKKSQGVNCFLRSRSEVYGEVLHDQRKKPAKMPPKAPIERWVERKLGIPKNVEASDLATQGKVSFAGIVFMIRRAIGKRGLRTIGEDGLQFFFDPLKENRNKYMNLIAKIIAKVKLRKKKKFVKAK